MGTAAPRWSNRPGAASGFLNFAAGSTSFTGIGAIVEKAAKHAFVDAWMGGVKNAVYGGELSPLRDAIGGALSSVGNGFIDSNMNTTALKVASSAVLGGTISEIGGGKFANGAVAGAYSMLFNELAHRGYEINNKKNFHRISGLTINQYFAVTVNDGQALGGYLVFSFTDPLVDGSTKGYQFVNNVYNGVSESGWDNGDLQKDQVKYPHCYNEGNHTMSFTDTSYTGPYKNGDYFHATVYINSSSGNILKLSWGWQIVNNHAQMEYIKTSYNKK